MWKSQLIKLQLKYFNFSELLRVFLFGCRPRSSSSSSSSSSSFAHAVNCLFLWLVCLELFYTARHSRFWKSFAIVNLLLFYYVISKLNFGDICCICQTMTLLRSSVVFLKSRNENIIVASKRLQELIINFHNRFQR